MRRLTRPVTIDPRNIRPVEANFTQVCSSCSECGPRWQIRIPLHIGEVWRPVCARCWLYDSPWAIDKREQIDALVADVEVALGRRFRVDDGGKLANGEDADRILSSIAMTSRIFYVADKKAAGTWR